MKKKLFISIKHDLIIGRDMPGTRHRKIFLEKLGLVENCCYFSTYQIAGWTNGIEYVGFIC